MAKSGGRRQTIQNRSVRFIEVEPEVADLVTELASARHMDESEMIGFMARAFSRKPRIYSLDETFEFGKYRGEKLRAVIHMDPGYVRWMIREATSVGVDQTAEDYLNKLTLAATKRSGFGSYDNRQFDRDRDELIFGDNYGGFHF